MNNYRVIKAGEAASSTWSGGSTTQLYIYPENAVYSDRDFDFRVSSATVELEESDFTKLAGYQRHILPLVGTMKLDHKEHHSVTLNPYETDEFSGDWETHCTGKCTDFNLMYSGGLKGEMKAVNGGASPVNVGEFVGIYSLTKLTVELETKVIELEKGDFFITRVEKAGEIKLKAGGGKNPAGILVKVYSK